MISERKFHHGGPGIANGVAVSAAIMVGQAGKEGGRVHSLLCYTEEKAGSNFKAHPWGHISV